MAKLAADGVDHRGRRRPPPWSALAAQQDWPMQPTSCVRRLLGRGDTLRPIRSRASQSSSPTAARRQDEIERMAATELGAAAPQPCWSEGRALGAEPAIGAALDALLLCGAHAPYATFGRWLRSPFFARPPAEQLACARLDAELRAELRSQLPFQAAYRCGLEELLETRAPVVGARANGRSRRHRRRASCDAGSVGAPVVALAGGARLATPPTARTTLLGWQSTLDELARLTPIFGEISLDGRASRARATARAHHARGAARSAGVHVLRRVEDVGPGYDAVWVTGFTDSAWPEPPHGNPLLPLALAARSAACRIRRLATREERSARACSSGSCSRSRELVVSWPARVYDYETEPSPAIRTWPTLTTDELGALDGRSAAAHVPAARDRRRRRAAVRRGPRAGGHRRARPPGALPRASVLPGPARRAAARAARASASRRGCVASRRIERPSGCSTTPRRSESLVAKHEQRSRRASTARSRGCSARARRHLAALYELEAEQLATRARCAAARGAAARAVSRTRRRTRIGRHPRTADVEGARRPHRRACRRHARDHRLQDRRAGDERATGSVTRLRDAQVPLYATPRRRDRRRRCRRARCAAPSASYSGFWPDARVSGPAQPSRGLADPVRSSSRGAANSSVLAARVRRGRHAHLARRLRGRSRPPTRR